MNTPSVPRAVMRAIRRVSLADARDGPLMFAQVREDPSIELQALAPSLGGTIAVVSSGGCTALSLVGAGAHRVAAVDVSRTQNHLVELKCATVRMLAASVATAFLGGHPMPGQRRLRLYELLAPLLTDAARAHWDRNENAINAGVLRAGRSERFIGLVAAAVEKLVVRKGGMTAMLEAESVAQQREIFRRYWAGWRWRVLFALLLNRWSMSRAYDSSFFEHTENRSFARHFRGLAEHTLTEIPARSNYFLHEMLTGRYPVQEAGGVPPYLTRAAVARAADAADRLSLVDGSMTAYLRSCADRSIDGFALSNICEWLDAREIDALFGQIARTATIGARVVFRNFVGWTEVPQQWRSVIVERCGYGERLIQRDRSLVQHRVVVCDVGEKSA
ncbi:MAG: BtaA family protein [Gemmatimonadota bacterium]|nr:BtaA family protein [Gemmatimonadota bacterium]